MYIKRYLLLIPLMLTLGCSNSKYSSIVPIQHNKVDLENLITINKLEEYNTNKYPYRTKNDFSENSVIIRENSFEVEDGYSYGTFRIYLKKGNINYEIIHDGTTVYLDYSNDDSKFKLCAKDDDRIYNLLKRRSLSYNDKVETINIKVLNAHTYDETHVSGVTSLNNVILLNVYSEDNYNYITTEYNGITVGVRKELNTFSVDNSDDYEQIDIKEMNKFIKKLVKYDNYTEELYQLGFVGNSIE